jgi:prepilin-type N-terminal cleavage/methylation domain-containing protein
MIVTPSVHRSRTRQGGFSLVEIAIVLVIIGLLVGGILKGQEMINSARVRNLADMTSAIQSAYFGFIDRYHRVPGDWERSAAEAGIGVPIVGGGNDNGRLDNPPGASVYDEASALWEHVSKAGFLQGNFVGTPGVEPNLDNNLAPLNAFNGVVTIGRTPDYIGTSPVRLHVVIGRNVPVHIIQELDIKMDDGVPHTGIIRATVAEGELAVFANTHNWGGRDPDCVNADGTLWNVSVDTRDCNAVLLF